MPPVYTLNLSSPTFGIISLEPFSFGSPVPIVYLDQLGEVSGPAIVYIVGHAVPNGLRDKDDGIINEAVIARKLNARKAPTLVVFDVCFAGTLEQIPGVEWSRDIVRIYSCKPYERTWNDGPTRQSLFSVELNRALPNCIRENSFNDLASILTTALGGLQTPEVYAGPDLRPRTFGLS